MRVALLTTGTTHHAYFAWKLATSADLAAIVVETRSPVPRFETHHPFEDERDEYERDVLLTGFDGQFADLAETHTVDSVNDAEPVLRRLAPDLVLVFGTTRLSSELIDMAGTACLNLHGGNPEEYRGLDTHLWTIYHRDFDNLMTTLHHADAGLDTGDIVHLDRLALEHLGIHQLRAVNTKLCLALTLRTLRELETGSAPRRAQRKHGRYYSFMPAVLKDECVEKFAAHVATL